MKKTLLLVFIHGFKGDDKTFHNFPRDLQALLSHTLPKANVLSIQYPKYETRGDLNECVRRFKEWLQNKVIDLEVANGTPSPTVDPSVHVVLCGHSMGGIVAAETLLSIVRDEAIPPASFPDDVNGPPQASNNTTTSAYNTSEASSRAPAASPDTSRLIFPFVRAILAFDTPFLGISPGVLAHGAEEHYNHASKAFKAYDTASALFGWGGNSAAEKAGSSAAAAAAAGGGTAAAAAAANNSTSKPTGNAWSKWGRYAMVGGAAAAAVAGVAGAAYLSRRQITEGLSWAGSHVEFVGCLARGAELQRRVEALVVLTAAPPHRALGFADFYTVLGERGKAARSSYAGAVLGDERTFCIVPAASTKRAPAEQRQEREAMGRRSDSPAGAATTAGDDAARVEREGAQVRDFAEDTSRSKGRWVRCVNDYAADEVAAHSSMFAPDRNPDYHAMLPRARDQIVDWVDMGWYEASTDGSEQPEGEELSLI